MKRKENKLITVIEKLSHDGRGIAKVDGKITFIDGALASEKVEFNLTKQKKDYNEGRVTEVLEASPLRVTPPCPHYDICGGCSLQHLNSQAQIEMKQQQLLDLLSRIGHCQPQTILPPLQTETLHYRGKARLSVKYVHKKDTVLIGFREKYHPRYIADISSCKILHQRVDALLMPLRTLINQMEGRENIAQVEVALGDVVLGLIFRHLLPLTQADLELLADFGSLHQVNIYLQPKGPETVHLFYPKDSTPFLTYQIPDSQVEFAFHPTDFTQVNLSLNRQMIARALTLLDLNENDVVLDLFCGLGNFSLPIAKKVHHVIGVEGSEAMVLRARMNAEKNGLTNTAFYAANLEEPGFLSQFSSMGITKLLIDPPRAGAYTVVKEIDIIQPQLIVYVSCDPATLARDASVLVNDAGYQLVSAGVMDMFPHTAHVESIAVFVRK